VLPIALLVNGKIIAQIVIQFVLIVKLLVCIVTQLLQNVQNVILGLLIPLLWILLQKTVLQIALLVNGKIIAQIVIQFVLLVKLLVCIVTQLPQNAQNAIHGLLIPLLWIPQQKIVLQIVRLLSGKITATMTILYVLLVKLLACIVTQLLQNAQNVILGLLIPLLWIPLQKIVLQIVRLLSGKIMGTMIILFVLLVVPLA